MLSLSKHGGYGRYAISFDRLRMTALFGYSDHSIARSAFAGDVYPVAGPYIFYTNR
jgi:hypothetical protein